MKKIKLSLLSFITLTSVSFLQAQTVDEIIDKYVEAAGGKDVINKINSIYMESTVSVMGNDAPATTTILNGKGYKTEMEMNGSKIVSCFTDTGGWVINPMMGSTSPQPMPDEQYKMGKLQLDIGGPLYNYKEKGIKVELQGQEKVGDINAYKLKVTTQDSNEVTYYIDPNTYHIIQASISTVFQGQPIDVTTTFSNFQKTDIGYVMPYSINTNYGGQFEMPITIKKVEVNKEIDPSAFEMPKQ
jgi:outer membrane lipoprotein-sorting protein